MLFDIQKHNLPDGRQLAVGALNDAPALNALSHDMAREMLAALDSWRTDDAVAAVLLVGGGERHFCAGGNVLNVVRLFGEKRWQDAGAYFYDEYHLDAVLATYPKPIIAWGNGALMGGGMGVFQGAGLRLVTDSVKMAMPEVHIGLAPDVGAARFLRRAPETLGLFVGFSGVTLNGFDACHANLADFVLPDSQRAEYIERLCAQWSDADNLAQARDIAAALALPADAEKSPLMQAQDEINACCNLAAPADIAAALAQSSLPWLRQAGEKLAAASPGAAAFWHRHWHAMRDAPLAQVLEADYRAILAFARAGEFSEGVRALLLDKDKSPRWTHSGINEVGPDWPPLAPEDAPAAERLRDAVAALG